MHEHAKPFSARELTNQKKYSVFTQKNKAWENFNDPLLEQLISVALVDSPNMQIAKARIRRAAALSSGAAATLWPTIDLNGYIQRQKFSKFGLVPPPFNGLTFNIADVGFNFNYDFDLWGKNRQILASRLDEACAEQADFAESKLIIATAVADTYFQLLNMMKQTRLAKDNLQISEKISNIVLTRSLHGIDSDIPVKTSLANVESARLSIQEFKEKDKLLRNELAILLGKNPFTTLIIPQHSIFNSRHIDLPNPLSINLIAHRPDVASAALRMSAAAHQINAAKARFFPNINLNALFSYQTIELNHLFDPASQNNAITGAIDLPIFDAGARRAALGIQYAEFDLAVIHYNPTILTALREIADELARLKTVNAQLRAQQQAVKDIAHNYKLFNSRYNHGVVDYVQVLEIKHLLLEQQAKQADLETKYQRTFIAMIKALGGNFMSSRDRNDKNIESNK